MNQVTKNRFYTLYSIVPNRYGYKKIKPNAYTRGAFSLFLEKLIKEGYEVEDYAKLRH